ncbi:MAG: hypothetical protein QM648_01650 [Solirubrobacterales bacterium]
MRAAISRWRSAARSIVMSPLRRALVDDALFLLAEEYSISNMVIAARTILAAGGDLASVAEQLAIAFRNGLETGLAVGIYTCPERSNPGRL